VGKPPPEEKYPPEGGGFKPKKMENKPKHLSSQRIDINSIIDIISKNPETFHNMSIGVKNQHTDKLEKGISTKGD
jgi:hypothetical protein